MLRLLLVLLVATSLALSSLHPHRRLTASDFSAVDSLEHHVSNSGLLSLSFTTLGERHTYYLDAMEDLFSRDFGKLPARAFGAHMDDGWVSATIGGYMGSSGAPGARELSATGSLQLVVTVSRGQNIIQIEPAFWHGLAGTTLDTMALVAFVFTEEQKTQAMHDGGASRSLLAYDPWFGANTCFPSDSVTRIMPVGLYVDHTFYQSYGSVESVKTAITSIMANTNLIYVNQMNIEIQVSHTTIKTEPGGVSWNAPCDNANIPLAKRLNYFEADASKVNASISHLLTNCYPLANNGQTSNVGLATMNQLCKNGGAVTTRTAGTYLTVAHEIGHNFGALHTFEEGEGTTGGIMDYQGNNNYQGTIQFNSKYRKTQVCAQITSSMDVNICGTMCISENVCWGAKNPVIGDGVKEANEECDVGANTACCIDGKLTGTCDGSDSTCCVNCQIQLPTTRCFHSGGMAGYCNAGKCRPSMCSSYSYGGSSLDFCGVDKTNICRENCFNTNVACQYFSPVDVADGVPCNNVKGTCQSGFCETPQTCGDGVKHSTEECDTGGDTACCRGCKLMFECDGLDATCCSNCRFQASTKICTIATTSQAGYCSRGSCQRSACRDYAANGGDLRPCGVNPNNACQERCENDDVSCQYLGANFNLKDGATCAMPGACSAGSCIASTYSPVTVSPSKPPTTPLSPVTSSPSSSGPTTAPTLTTPTSKSPTSASPTAAERTTVAIDTKSPVQSASELNTSTPITFAPVTQRPSTSAPVTKTPTRTPTSIPPMGPTPRKVVVVTPGKASSVALGDTSDVAAAARTKTFANIDIPAEAVALEMSFYPQIMETVSKPPANIVFDGLAFSLSASTTSADGHFYFLAPITMVVSYKASVQASVESPVLLFWDEGLAKWVDAAETCETPSWAVNVATKTLSVSVCHLTTFALFTSTIPDFPASLQVAPVADAMHTATVTWTAPVFDGGTAVCQYIILFSSSAEKLDGFTHVGMLPNAQNVTMDTCNGSQLVADSGLEYVVATGFDRSAFVQITEAGIYFFKVAALNRAGLSPAMGRVSVELSAPIRITSSPTPLPKLAVGESISLFVTALPLWAIVVSITALVFIVFAIVCLAWMCCCRRRKTRVSSLPTPHVKLPEPDVREPPITIDDYLDAYPMEMMPLPSGPHVPTPYQDDRPLRPTQIPTMAPKSLNQYDTDDGEERRSRGKKKKKVSSQKKKKRVSRSEKGVEDLGSAERSPKRKKDRRAKVRVEPVPDSSRPMTPAFQSWSTNLGGHRSMSKPNAYTGEKIW